MAHQIEKYDMQEGVEQAWHGLTQVRPVITLEDCWLAKWDVERIPLFIEGERNDMQTPWAWLRCTDIPRFVGKPIGPSYGVIDNKSFLEMIREATSGVGHRIHSVGSVRNRGRVFVTIKLDQDHVRKVAKREFQDYLTFGNSHDQSSELFVVNSSVCTVCDNTFSMNLATVRSKVEDDDGEMEADTVDARLRHSKHAALKLPAIAKMIDRVVGVRAEFYKALDSLTTIKCNQARAEQLFSGFEAGEKANSIATVTRNRVGELVTLFKTGKGNRGENMADVFQATTDFYTHSHTRGDLQKQFEASEYGSGMVAKRQMFDILTDESKLEKTIKRGERLLANVEQFA